MSVPAYNWRGQPEIHALREKGDAVHFGAWAIIMTARLSVARHADEDAYTPEKFDHTAAIIDARLDQHGEPPLAFARCWLRDMADTYQWIADNAESAAARLAAMEWVNALRKTWKRYAVEVAA